MKCATAETYGFRLNAPPASDTHSIVVRDLGCVPHFPGYAAEPAVPRQPEPPSKAPYAAALRLDSTPTHPIRSQQVQFLSGLAGTPIGEAMNLNGPVRIALFAAIACAIVYIATVLVVGSGPSTTTATTITSSYPPRAAQSLVSEESPALAKLSTLPVKGRAPKTHFDRALFGSPWSDDVDVEEGHNGCDTRNDILRRDLTGVGFKPGRKACIVLSGVLNDPYSGESVLYKRGPGSSSRIQIDHIVPILDAWQKGAREWDYMTRRNFANDPINLQATTAAANDQKGSSDAASWLPPNKAYRCTYATRIVDVKARYGLWTTQPEHDALARVLTAC